MDSTTKSPPLWIGADKLSAGFLKILTKTLDVIDEKVVWMNSASQVLYANQTMCKKLEYSYEELPGMKVWDWDPLFPQESWSGFWADLKKRQQMQFESWHRTKSGHSFPVEITAFYFEDDDKEYLIATVKDISKLESISSEKELLSTAVKHTSSGIVITDAMRNVTWVNEGFSKITGYALEDVEGQSLKPVLQRENTNKDTLLKMKTLLDSRLLVDVEILNYHKSGRPYWNHLRITPIIEHGKRTHFVAVQDDITVYKQTDEASLAAMAKFQQLVDLLSVGVYMADANGNYTFVNPFWCNMAGFGIEEARAMVGKRLCTRTTEST